MCGRSACTLDPQTIKDNLHTQRWDNQDRYHKSYNVAPTRYQPVVLNENGRVLKSMKWGYMGNNAQLSTINARSEGITSSPMWSKLVPTNRCAVIASGYYEWQTTGGEGSKKQPHFVRMKDQPLMVMAGLYEEQLEENESEPVYHYTIITTQNSKDLGWLHDRMPVILDSDEKIDLWLSLDFFSLKSQILSLLRPFEGLDCYAVPEIVNSNRNDTPDCIRRLDDFKKTGGIAAFFQAPKKEIKSEPVADYKRESKKKEVVKKPAGITAFFAPKKEERKEDVKVEQKNEDKIKEEEEAVRQEELQSMKDEIKRELKEEIIDEIKEEVKDEIKKELQEEEEKEEDKQETEIKDEDSDKEVETAKKTTREAKKASAETNTRKRKLNDEEEEEEIPKGKKGKSKK